MTAHTPGPWEANPMYLTRPSGRRTVTGHHIRAETSALVAIVRDWAGEGTRERAAREKSAEREANARLLAASPDLLQVARDYVLLCELFDWDGLVFQSAVAAIAKAEGGE